MFLICGFPVSTCVYAGSGRYTFMGEKWGGVCNGGGGEEDDEFDLVSKSLSFKFPYTVTPLLLYSTNNNIYINTCVCVCDLYYIYLCI